MNEQSIGAIPSSAARYTQGGDEFLFVEFDQAMNLVANYLATTVAHGLEQLDLNGVIDVCPANASLLVRFDPDVLPIGELERHVKELEAQSRTSTQHITETRIIEVPVWYQDPYTSEVVHRFREGYHQDPSGTDLDYAAEVNGLVDAAEFIRRHHESPWLVSMVGFVAGLPFMYQLVPDARQLEVPKYLSPRTDTPPLTVGHGGCFACIYSVRGAGGYQMFGIAAAPIYDPGQELADFEEFLILFHPGDIVKFRPVEESEYREIQEQVAAGTWQYKQAPVSFDVEAALADPDTYNRTLLEALDGAEN